MSQYEQAVAQEDVMIEEADFALRDLLGPDIELRKVFTQEKIKDCQKIIDEAREEFFTDEIKKVLEIRKLVQTQDEKLFKEIALLGQDLKSQARLFGFGFISNICAQIIFYAETDVKNIKTRFTVISKFVDALDQAMKHRLKDETGQLEKNLMSMFAHTTSS